MIIELFVFDVPFPVTLATLLANVRNMLNFIFVASDVYWNRNNQ